MPNEKYIKGYITDELINDVLQWGVDKGLNDPKAQLNKVIEEVGEIAHEITRNKNGDELKDAIGDSLVTIIILSGICGYDPIECLARAYFEIKDRGGKTENGTFVKDVQEGGEENTGVYVDDDDEEIELIRNRCKCKKCGDIIESKSVHDFVRCKCGACFTDGGLDYIHRGGDCEPLDEFIKVKGFTKGKE